jgi:SsrA-binding protein
MATTRKKSPGKKAKVIADNRKARYSYEIVECFEAGIQLQGSEVKSLRLNGASIKESYAEVKDGEMWLVNANIPIFTQANRNNHVPTRPRKLLMHRREIDRLGAAVQRQGMTLVPMALYFNDRNRAKVEVGLGRGKKMHDKRQTEKDRDWKRQQGRILRDRG